MKTERWGSGVRGRNHTVARGELVWTVSNATVAGSPLPEQVQQTLAFLEQSLLAAGSSRHDLLSVQVLLVDIAHRDVFNTLWCDWIGDNPDHWPQRAVYQAALAPGLLIEIIATASRAGP